MPLVSIIAAMGLNRGIGFERHLPWNEPIPADWENLFRVTKGKKMIMGRKSYDDPHRVSSENGNYVISRQKNYPLEPGFELVGSLNEALEKCNSEEEVFVLGGEEIFREALPIVDKMHLTIVHETFPSDTFFPEFNENDFVITDRKEYKKGENTPYPLTILTYQRK